MVDWIQVGSQYVGLRDQINDKFSSTCSTRTYDENSLHLPLMCLSCCKRELQYKEVDQRSTIFSRLSVSGKSDCHAFSTKLYTSHLLLLGKFEYGGGPIFKVVLEC